MRPEKTYTIEDFIKSGKGVTLTYQNLSLKNNIGDKIKFPFMNVFNTYLDDIVDSALIKTVKLNDEEYARYEFRPKLLAYDIYGSTDLYFVILAINRILSPKDFRVKKLKMISKQDLNTIMTYIYNAEKGLIKKFS